MERVSTLITRGSTALTRATKIAAMTPKGKSFCRMKKLPVRNAADRNPDRAHVVDLHNHRRRNINDMSIATRAPIGSTSISTSRTTWNDWRQAAQQKVDIFDGLSSSAASTTQPQKHPQSTEKGTINQKHAPLKYGGVDVFPEHVRRFFGFVYPAHPPADHSLLVDILAAELGQMLFPKTFFKTMWNIARSGRVLEYTWSGTDVYLGST